MEKYIDELTLVNELLQKTHILISALLENSKGIHFTAYPGAFNTRVEEVQKVLQVIQDKYGAK